MLEPSAESLAALRDLVREHQRAYRETVALLARIEALQGRIVEQARAVLGPDAPTDPEEAVVAAGRIAIERGPDLWR